MRWSRGEAGRPVALILVACGALSAAAEEVEVLNAGTIWRFCAIYRPPQDEAVEALERTRGRWVRWGDELSGPLPPGAWAAADFDDAGWPRRRAPFFGVYGCARRAGLALLCVRGRFGVAQPSKAGELKLVLRYRGGVVVYLNGREVARGHLPEGEVGPLTPAEPYPAEAFLEPGGKKPLRTLWGKEPPEKLARRYRMRLRTLQATIPSAALRRGVNVLAIELHRAPVPPEVRRLRRFQENWHTAGLVEATLAAGSGSGVEANTAPPVGVQVWKATPLLRVGRDADYGDPFEPLRAVELLAPRNGVASGQVVVTARADLPALAAAPVPVEVPALRGEVSDLRSETGGRVPSDAVRIRYARPYGDEGFVALHEEPAGPAEVQAVWLTARVPRDAPPGAYRGELRIRGLAEPVRVPVELEVYGWTLGDPREWETWVNLLQSPESVAGHYGVPPWSDEHFRLMAPSFRLMGECGNDVLGVSAVGHSVFGNDPVVVFRREAGRVVPELEFLRRYLELYDRCAGPPKFLVLHVWNWEMYKRGAGRGGGDEEWRAATIPVMELRDGELEPLDLPIYGEPGTEATWRAVMDGVHEIVTDLGWPERCVLLGTSCDGWPHRRTIEMFQKVAPYARWRAITHGSGVPRWGESRQDRTQPNGMVVACLEIVRRVTNLRPRVEGCPTCCNARDCTRTDPFQYRSLPLLTTISAFFDGFCWKGVDYWPYRVSGGKRRSALNTYVRFGNIVGSTPRTIAAPGPRGAIATVQYEMLREGIQDTEAMLFLRRVLDDGGSRARLDDALARRCRSVMEEMLCAFETGARFSPQGGADVRRHVRRLWAVAAEVAEAVGQ